MNRLRLEMSVHSLQEHSGYGAILFAENYRKTVFSEAHAKLLFRENTLTPKLKNQVNRFKIF